MRLSTFVDTCARSFIMVCPLLWTLRVFAYYALSTFVDTAASAQLTASGKRLAAALLCQAVLDKII